MKMRQANCINKMVEIEQLIDAFPDDAKEKAWGLVELGLANVLGGLRDGNVAALNLAFDAQGEASKYALAQIAALIGIDGKPN